MRLQSAPSVWEERAGVEDCFVVQPVFISVTSSHLWGDVFINVPLPDQWERPARLGPPAPPSPPLL